MKRVKQVKQNNHSKNIYRNKSKQYQLVSKRPYGYQQQVKQKKKWKQNLKPKRRIRYGRLLIVIACLTLFFFVLAKCLEIPISNIYIKGNITISDQEIIELAGIENYPSIIKTRIFDLQRKLKKDPRIRSVKIQKKNWKEIHITIEENIPLFYNQTTQYTILSDLKEVESALDAPVLLNYVPDTIYETFKEKMQKIDAEILNRVSEIMYQPSTVDEERFLFTMRDGNYVYLTLETFQNINNYVNIYAEFTSKYGNKKGILNLDSGQYFTILE